MSHSVCLCVPLSVCRSVDKILVSVKALAGIKLHLVIALVLFQVDLSEPILSRFDILCVVRDTVDPIQVR